MSLAAPRHALQLEMCGHGLVVMPRAGVGWSGIKVTKSPPATADPCHQSQPDWPPGLQMPSCSQRGLLGAEIVARGGPKQQPCTWCTQEHAGCGCQGPAAPARVPAEGTPPLPCHYHRHHHHYHATTTATTSTATA